MARQPAPLLIASVGATTVFLLGGIDLSRKTTQVGRELRLGVPVIFWLSLAVLGDNLLLQVIAAVVTGLALITILDKGLNLQGLAFYDQAIAIGLVIILGSALGVWLRRRQPG